ncbi:MAG: AtpZ/AtpI family protein [Campylobacterota bacterium]|nr:AtpZ/AtpI family protein [Campylobacterota bacterium]
MEENIEKETPKHREKLESLDNISLGISIVVAIALGVGIGLLLKNLTGYTWTLWIGVAYGIAAAILNVYKAYKKAKKDLDKLADDPKYANLKENGYDYSKEDDDK